MGRLALPLCAALLTSLPAAAATVKYDAKTPPKASASLAATSIEAIPALAAKGYAPEYAQNTTVERTYARSVWNAPNSKVDHAKANALFSYIRRGTAVFDLGEDFGSAAFVVGTPGATNVFSFLDDGGEVLRLTGDQIAAAAGVTSLHSVTVQVKDVVFDTLKISAVGGGPSVEFANLYVSDKNPRRFTSATAGVTVSSFSAAAIAPVPTPGTAGFLVAALGVLGWRGGRRG